MNTISLEEIENVNLHQALEGKILSGSDMASDLLCYLAQDATSQQSLRTRYWYQYNNLIGGQRPCELTVISSDTGMGKTTFAINLATDTLMQGKAVLYIALENTPLNVLWQMTKIGTREHIPRNPSNEELNIVKTFCETDGARLFFLEQAKSIQVDTILQAIVYCKQKFGVFTVVLDHLDAINLRQGRNQSETTAQKNIMYQLHNITKKMEISLIVIQHPSKLGDKGGYGKVKLRQDRHMSLDELKGSSAVKQVADVAITLRRPSEIPNSTEIMFQKIRDFEYGRNIGKSLTFTMNPETLELSEYV